MLVVHKNCEDCGAKYDQRLEFCPKCKKINEQSKSFGYKDKACWLPMLYQALYLIIGCVGLSSISFVITLICTLIMGDTSQLQLLAIVNFTTYAVILCGLIGLSIPNIRYFKSSFNRWTPYIIGIAGAIIIICFSLFYNWFINLFYKLEDSENQKIATQLVINYPAVSIIFLGLIGPICEELTYRVGLFTMSKRLHRVFAYFITMLVFGLMHFDFTNKNIINELINLPIYMICGAAFSFLYDKFGLSASMTAHIGNNLYSVIAILILHSQGKI